MALYTLNGKPFAPERQSGYKLLHLSLQSLSLAFYVAALHFGISINGALSMLLLGLFVALQVSLNIFA